MAKVKGIKKLNKAILEQFAQFGIEKIKVTDEFSYIYLKNKITYKITEGDIEDKLFCEHIKERFGYEVKYPFIMFMLHEVGHHLNNDCIDDTLEDFCTREKDRIEEEMAEALTADEVRKLEWQYFGLPDEIMASAWAVDFAKENPAEIERMWKAIEKAFHKFYAKNLDMINIED